MLKPRVVFVGAIVGLLSLAYALQLSPGLGVAAAEQAQEFVPVTDEMLLDPDPEDWLMVHRTYDFQAYSPLDQINRDNVDQLKLAWMRAMDPGPQEIRPLVYDGVMYIAHAGGDHLQALDATTGDLIWDYERTLPEDLREYATIGNRTRHLAIYGDNIFHLTADAYLVALDARTGELAWESQMADYHEGITHSSGAMIIKGRVLSGRTCSPSSLEARCFVAAHDAETGTELWRTYTAAGADDPGGATWGDLPTARRVHVSPWGVPGSYDPELDLIYWGVAVPLPYPRIVRRGTWDVGDRTPCELYSNSTLALAADTGEIDWYYQHLPCDDWDQDFVQDRTLIDTVVNPDPEAVMWINPKLAGTAEERKIVVTLGEPGGLFVNDRETGEFLWASPLPYTSTERFVIRDIDVETGAVYINMDLVAKEVGQRFVICGHNVKGWWSWSYSPVTGLLYIPFNRSCLDQTANDRTISGASPRFTIPEPGFEEDGHLTEVRAIDISTGREVWRYSQRAPNMGSTLATAGNVVFFGDLNRRLWAFDAETGTILWQTILGSQITGYPVTYAVGGRQYLTVPVGGVDNRMATYTPELEAPSGSNMLVTFTLPEPAVGGPAPASSASSEASAQADSERAGVVGTYQIVGRRTKDADGNWQTVEGFNSVGYITYSDTGHMSVNVMPKGRTAFDDTQPTPEEAQTALQGYTAYYGPFSTHEDEDGKYLVHHRLATINPSGELDAKRYYHFEGDRFILTPAAGDGSKTQAARQVVWQRLPDVELSEEAKRFVGFRQLLYTDRYSERAGQLVSHDQRNESRAGSYIIYTPTGHMMVHLTPREGRARYAGATPTPDEALEAYQTYGGYFGTFTVHENADPAYVVHHQEGRSRPSAPTDGVRLYQLDGDVLRLGGRPRGEDGVVTGGHLYWELMPARPE